MGIVDDNDRMCNRRGISLGEGRTTGLAIICQPISAVTGSRALLGHILVRVAPAVVISAKLREGRSVRRVQIADHRTPYTSCALIGCDCINGRWGRLVGSWALGKDPLDESQEGSYDKEEGAIR
jgi:hypothetical protein